jgi:drug/metabolite transporter (DMT)-like permease
MWAFQFSGAKIATAHLGPITVTFLPMAVSTLFFAPFVFYGPRRKEKCASKNVILGFIAVGTLGIAAAQLGLTWGVQYSLASNAAVLTLTIPVLTAVIAGVVLGERMTALRWLSFVLALVGVLIVSDVDWRSVDMFHHRYFAGNMLIFVSCFGSAFYNSYSKKLLESFSPVEVLVYSFLVTDIVLLVLLLIYEPPNWKQLASLDAGFWFTLSVIAVFSLSLSTVLYFWVIERIDVTQASLSIYMLPVLGVGISTIALHEKVTVRLMAGGALVVVATFLVTTYEERLKARQERLRLAAEEI